ncbi:hypothetical protein HK096_006622 [Nowakowskiella sp. JEL0078]|nr:hypothetical protein HK096_006622 [Nowakowskiella sp. JEL0078]
MKAVTISAIPVEYKLKPAASVPLTSDCEEGETMKVPWLPIDTDDKELASGDDDKSGWLVKKDISAVSGGREVITLGNVDAGEDTVALRTPGTDKLSNEYQPPSNRRRNIFEFEGNGILKNPQMLVKETISMELKDFNATQDFPESIEIWKLIVNPPGLLVNSHTSTFAGTAVSRIKSFVYAIPPEAGVEVAQPTTFGGL